MDSDEDRRRFHRILFQTTTRLQQGDMISSCELLDVSLRGLLVKVREDVHFQESEPIEAQIQLTDETHVCMTLGLAWRRADQMGLTCISIDLDSMCHLRRLIELNLCDPEAAARDLSQLAEQEPAHSTDV